MRHFVWSVFFLVIFADSSALTQIARGTPPFGSFGGGPDIINLGNLNGHLTIPVFGRAGRGRSFEYDLAYDTSIWYPVTSSGTTSWQPVTNWGWTGTADLATPATGVLTAHASSFKCGGTWGILYRWTYTDKSGSPHSFPGTTSEDCGNPTSLNVHASDGSGYYLQATGSGGTATWRNGTLFGNNGSLTDNNGNKTTVSGSSVYDTLSSTVAVLTATGTPSSPPVKYAYTNPQGGTSYVTVTYVAHTVKTAFGCSTVTGEYNQSNIPLVDQVQMPDGGVYSFTYETTPGYSGQTVVTGRLASISLPTGGSISYTYTGANHGIVCTDGSAAGITRVVAPAVPSSEPSGTWTYTRTQVSGAHWQTKVTTPPDPTVGNDTVIDFWQDSATTNFYEVQRKAYQGSSSGGTLLLTAQNCYNANFGACVTTAVATPINQIDAYQQLPNGKTSATETSINGSTGLVTEMKAYDYGVTLGSAPSSTYLLRDTVINYASLGNGLIVDHPSQVTVRDGAGNTKSQTTYTYDEGSITQTSGTPQLTSPPNGARGNLTTVSSLTSGTSTISKHFSYYDTGNVNVATDVNAATTTYKYGSGTSCGNSFPTEIDLPITSPSLVQYLSWNCAGSVVTSSTDVNGNVTTYKFTEPNSWRLSEIDFPDSASDTETFTYSTGATTPWTIQTTKSVDSTQNAWFETYLDGLGRTYANYNADPQSSNGNNHVWTYYDSLGRVSSVTNPYFTASDPTYGATSFTYDALGRVTKVTNPDSTSRTIQFTNRAQLVTDELGIERAYQFDGLGRLQYVCDGIGAGTQANSATTSSCGLDVSENGFLSTYAYDPLGNLTSATVGAHTGYSGQTRSYTYDGLSRMLTSSDPESGSATYVYDGGTAGDLYTRTFPKPNVSSGTVTATYSWDALHRPTYISFSDGSNAYAYTYDSSSVWGTTVHNPKGNLVLQNHSGIAASIYSYDTMGRLTDNWGCTPDTCGTTSKHLGYTYNFLGEPTTIADGGGSYSFTYTYNKAGEVTGVTSSLSDSTHPGTLFSTPSSGAYNAFGELTQGTYGDGIVRNNTYDQMGRLTEIQDGSTSSPKYRLYLSYYGNGSVHTYNDTVGGGWTYTYDKFNRLATSSNGDTGNAYSYSYDQFGNRWQQTVTAGTGYSSSYAFNNNNRITSGGFSYDAGGNLTSDGSCSPCWVYDDAGNLTGGGNATFAYDALGQRVQKISSSGTTFDFALGLDGHPFDEYQGTVHSRVTGGLFTYANGTTYFNKTDHQGTPRVTTDYTGAIQRTESNLAFGDGFIETNGGIDYTGFANGFWDAEINADHFGAREYAKAQGRWLTPDPAGLAAVDPTNPQTWNRYAYALNNPLSLIDPLGLCDETDDSDCTDVSTWGCGDEGLCADGNGFVLGLNQVPGVTITVTADPSSVDVGISDLVDVSFGVDPTLSNPLSNGGVIANCAQTPPGTPSKYCGPLQQGIDTAKKALQKKGCGAFYGGQGPQTLDATTYRFLDLNNPTTGAATIDPSTVFINSNGPYMNFAPAPGKPGPFGLYWTQSQFRAFILLHELGHQLSPITGFKPDAGSPLNKAQSGQVLSRCF